VAQGCAAKIDRGKRWILPAKQTSHLWFSGRIDQDLPGTNDVNATRSGHPGGVAARRGGVGRIIPFKPP